MMVLVLALPARASESSEKPESDHTEIESHDILTEIPGEGDEEYFPTEPIEEIIPDDISAVFDRAAPELDCTPSFIAQGQCGADLYYAITTDYYLLIVGTGAMWDYALDENDKPYTPWYSYRSLITAVGIDDNCTYIGSHAFEDMYAVSQFVLSDTIESIGERAFFYCPSVQHITLPKNLRALGDGAFFACVALTEIVLPDTVESIGTLCFANCNSLKSAALPSMLTTIPLGMFAEDTSLSAVTIPSSVKSISELAFNGCTALKTVNFGGSKSQWRTVSIGAENTPIHAATVYCAESDPTPTPIPIQGDANSDGDLTSNDAALILKNTHSGKYSAYDAVLVLKKLVGG